MTTGAKAHLLLATDAALKGRSSTVVYAVVMVHGAKFLGWLLN